MKIHLIFSDKYVKNLTNKRLREIYEKSEKYSLRKFCITNPLSYFTTVYTLSVFSLLKTIFSLCHLTKVMEAPWTPVTT